MIFKAQRPISGQPGPWLVYNQGQTIVQAIPFDDVPPDLGKIMGDKFKVYFTGRLEGASIVVEAAVIDQGW